MFRPRCSSALKQQIVSGCKAVLTWLVKQHRQEFISRREKRAAMSMLMTFRIPLCLFDLSLCTGSIYEAKVLVVGFLLAVTLHLFMQQRKKKKRPLNLPPGPRPWPILGNLLQIGPIPHLGMMKFTRIYGPLVYIRIGMVPAVVTDDPCIVKEFLKRQDHVFASRPINLASEIFTFKGKDIAFAPFGPHWKNMRRLCLLELLTPKKLEGFRAGRMEELQLMVREVFEASKLGKAINIRDTFGALSSNTLTRMLLGKRFFGAGDASAEQAAEHKALIYEGFSLVNAFNIGDYLPFLRRFDFQGHEKRMKELIARIHEIYDPIIEEHRLKRKALEHEGVQDFVDILLSLWDEDGGEKADTVMIKAVLLDMVSAGTDTSSNTSEWTMTELLRHPDIMLNVQQEIDLVVGLDRVVEEADLSKLRYLRAVVKEIFRLHPVGAFLIPHLSVEDAKVAGYDIPKNTRILINTYSLGRNPSVWTNSTQFQPERFLEDHVELSDPDLRIVPFGAGRRGCPGATLGTSMVLLGLARLIHGFNWLPPSKQRLEEADIVEGFNSMVKATPLQAMASSRLPVHLY